MKRTIHKALSMLLTAAMVLNMGLTPVFASEGSTTPGVSGVCTHHAEHTEDCYAQTENCKHEHDEACGYTPDTACSFDPASCTECNPGDKPAEKVCTCPPVDSGNLPQGEQIHSKDCPLFAAQPTTSETVTALIALVDALPAAEAITEENRETTMPAFEAAATAYGELPDDDKTVFEETQQYTKLMALHTVLFAAVPMINEATWDMKDGPPHT